MGVRPGDERSPLLAEFLALEADPLTLVLLVSAERGRHHCHAAVRADRWTLVPSHVTSIVTESDDLTVAAVAGEVAG